MRGLARRSSVGLPVSALPPAAASPPPRSDRTTATTPARRIAASSFLESGGCNAWTTRERTGEKQELGGSALVRRRETKQQRGRAIRKVEDAVGGVRVEQLPQRAIEALAVRHPTKHVRA